MHVHSYLSRVGRLHANCDQDVPGLANAEEHPNRYRPLLMCRLLLDARLNRVPLLPETRWHSYRTQELDCRTFHTRSKTHNASRMMTNLYLSQPTTCIATTSLGPTTAVEERTAHYVQHASISSTFCFPDLICVIADVYKLNTGHVIRCNSVPSGALGQSNIRIYVVPGVCGIPGSMTF